MTPLIKSLSKRICTRPIVRSGPVNFVSFIYDLSRVKPIDQSTAKAEGAGPAVAWFRQDLFGSPVATPGPMMRELPVHNVQAIRIFLHLLRIFFKRPKSSLFCPKTA